MNLRRFAKRRQAQIENGKLNLCLWKDGDNSYHLKGMWSDAQHILLTGNNMNPRAFRPGSGKRFADSRPGTATAITKPCRAAAHPADTTHQSLPPTGKRT
jgi:hypothetical protein